MEQIYEIQLDNGARLTANGDDSLCLKPGDNCIFRKDFYQDFGRITRIIPSKTSGENSPEAAVSESASDGSSIKNADLPRILRKATDTDEGKAAENHARCKSILRTTGEYVERLGLPMKLINAHNSQDGKMITIQFSADGRVDFRELVKQLSSEFNTRIELRQIGVRDETAIVGGISVCGRPLCCCQFLHDFASINVKMAKEQDLSLTPSTISGICGRLKCCLKYEHEGYLELEKNMPRRGDFCECPEGRGRVMDRNLLAQKVVVQLEDSDRSVVCNREDVRVIYPDKSRTPGGGGKNAVSRDSKTDSSGRNNGKGSSSCGGSSRNNPGNGNPAGARERDPGKNTAPGKTEKK